MFELKDTQDRGVQITVSEDRKVLRLSGPDGVIELGSFAVEKLVKVLMPLVDSALMVSAPVLITQQAAPQNGTSFSVETVKTVLEPQA